MKDWAYVRIFIMLVTSMLIVSIIAAYLPQQPDLSIHILTKPKVLFSLQYGEGDSQMGMFIPHPAAEEAGEPMGPSDFAVGADGCIYIGDEQNGKVKKFSRNGKLLMMTEG
jgi:sugar lactone lactonase YvrE